MAILSTDILLLDGPTGTELERRGASLASPLWSAALIESDPDLILSVHRDYVEAGADIITANTFRTNPNSLNRRDRLDVSKALTRSAVDLARASIGERPLLVAGSVAPVGDCYRPGEGRSHEDLERDHTIHISNIVEAGVDLLLIETMNSLAEAELVSRLALEHDIPVFVSLVCDRSGTRMLDGTDLTHAVIRLASFDIDAILLNCASPTATAGGVNIVEASREESDSEFRSGGYPNSGDPDPVLGWEQVREVSDEEFDDAVFSILRAGGSVVGSCCGTTPETTVRLRRLVDRFVSDRKGD